MLHFFVTLQTLVTERKDAALSNDRGATAVEYGLLVALIAAVIIIAVTALGETISDIFSGVVDDINGS